MAVTWLKIWLISIALVPVRDRAKANIAKTVAAHTGLSPGGILAISCLLVSGG